jgi:membrane associated rhomboid family serine protease
VTDAPRRERVFNAPLASILVVVSIPALFIVQRELPDGGLGLAFRPASLTDGQWWPGLLTAMFLHAGWAHVGMNALGALAFGPPVARRMPGAAGAAGFILFYMTSGVVAAFGFGLVHLDSQSIMVGASGAISALTGAAIRMLGRSDGGLRPLTDRRVLTTSAVLLAANAAVGLIGLVPGGEAAGIAWEAHAFGYLFGLLAIGPWSRIFSGRS